VCEYSPWKKYHKPGNKSYGIVLGTVIKKLKVKISTFLNKTKFDIVILKFSLFQSLKVRLPFLQSDIFRTLNICSSVTNGYRGDGQALEMGRKVGWGAFGVNRKAKNLQK
jgi:hypothetical protein